MDAGAIGIDSFMPEAEISPAVSASQHRMRVGFIQAPAREAA